MLIKCMNNNLNYMNNSKHKKINKYKNYKKKFKI